MFSDESLSGRTVALNPNIQRLRGRSKEVDGISSRDMKTVSVKLTNAADHAADVEKKMPGADSAPQQDKREEEKVRVKSIDRPVFIRTKPKEEYKHSIPEAKNVYLK